MVRTGLLAALVCVGGVLGAGAPARASDSPCDHATSVGVGSHNGSLPCGTGGQFLDLPGDCAASAHNIWFTFTAPAQGTYFIDTNGTPSVDTVLKVFRSCADLANNRIACDDDGGDGPGNSRTSLTKVKLNAGDTIKIAVGAYFEEEALVGSVECGPIVLNIRLVQEDPCEGALWVNGAYDETGAQTSQLGYDEHWNRYERVAADDFFLCDGSVYRIRELRGVMCTDSVLPKARVLIVRDCNGDPYGERTPLAYADSVRPSQTEIDALGACIIGDVTIEETGLVNADGFRIINVTARFDRLWLRGGAFHALFIGYSGTANPLEQFFWGFAGNGTVKGRPGLFRDSDAQQDGWVETSSLCCGCTDFAFSVYGSACKILLDQDGLTRAFTAPPALQDGFPGVPSLQNGTSTSSKVRAADDFVVPPCNDLRLCYIEAIVLSNCSRVRLDVFDNECKTPADDPIYSVDAACVTRVGSIGIGSDSLDVLRAEFFDFKSPRLDAGHQYWISVYALGENRQNARGYFAYGFRCDKHCYTFNPPQVKGPPYATQPWRPAQPAHTVSISGGTDLALTVAVMEAAGMTVTAPTPCRADVNSDGTVTLQDLFDFLTAFFAGCP